MNDPITSPEADAATADVLSAFGAESAFFGLPEAASKIHKGLLRIYAETGHPPTAPSLSAATGLSRPNVESALAELARRDLIVVEDNLIVGAYPFTERDTGITVRCAGDAVHAMCAVDALGTGAMLDRDSEIDARCVYCSATISARTTAEGTRLRDATPETAVVWVGIRREDGPAASSLSLHGHPLRVSPRARRGVAQDRGTHGGPPPEHERRSRGGARDLRESAQGAASGSKLTMTELKRTCPSCHQPARSIPLTTVRRLTKTARPTNWDAAWFCATPSCEVVYFEADGEHLDEPDLRVQVFQKREGMTRPVCYCFEHSVADVRAGAREDGSNRIVDEIIDACRQGLDRCEETNPQGRCCLGNVRGLLRAEARDSCCGGCQ